MRKGLVILFALLTLGMAVSSNDRVNAQGEAARAVAVLNPTENSQVRGLVTFTRSEARSGLSPMSPV